MNTDLICVYPCMKSVSRSAVFHFRNAIRELGLQQRVHRSYSEKKRVFCHDKACVFHIKFAFPLCCAEMK